MRRFLCAGFSRVMIEIAGLVEVRSGQMACPDIYVLSTLYAVTVYDRVSTRVVVPPVDLHSIKARGVRVTGSRTHDGSTRASFYAVELIHNRIKPTGIV